MQQFSNGQRTLSQLNLEHNNIGKTIFHKGQHMLLIVNITPNWPHTLHTCQIHYKNVQAML